MRTRPPSAPVPCSGPGAALPRRSRPSRGSGRLRAIAACLVLLGLAAPASATPETLKRSVGNILFAPFDLFFAPVVGPTMSYQSMRYIDDTPGVRTFYAVPGAAWKTALVVGMGVIREMTGIIEFIPGLFLFFSDSDLDPLLAPAEDENALVDIEGSFLNVRAGIFYTE